jgi:hypothetical protein
MRLAGTLGLGAASALVWACACVAVGLPIALTVACAGLAGAGGVLAGAICGMGARGDEHAGAEPTREPDVAAVARGDRWSRKRTRAATKDRVA